MNEELPEANNLNNATDEQLKINPTNVKQQVRKWDRLNDLEYICGICDQKYAQKKGFEKHVALHGICIRLILSVNKKRNNNLCRSRW